MAIVEYADFGSLQGGLTSDDIKAMTGVAAPRLTHEEINHHVELYLARGRAIQQIEIGVCTGFVVSRFTRKKKI